mmetsp:Transcript_33646/g.95157  ORF Transcript_33646/g.95157 Transcript_33646/m.95157 type:complete len:304 (-) Transcript_33646:933-1844(-)
MTSRPANHRPLRALWAFCAASTVANLRYTNPLLILSTWWCSTGPNLLHSSFTSSPISTSQSGSVSVEGSNIFFRRTHGVAMGDLGPRTPCSSASGLLDSGGGPGGVGRRAAGGGPSGVVLAPLPALPGMVLTPDSRAMSAALDCAESLRPPPSSSSSSLTFMPVGGAALISGITGRTGATVTWILSPAISRSFSCCIALAASPICLYCTKPTPMEPPATSFVIVAKSSSPKGAKMEWRSESTTLGWTLATCSLQGPVPMPSRLGNAGGGGATMLACWVACAASQAMFFSASEAFTITDCPSSG